MHLWLYPKRMLACLVLMFYILKTKKKINHFIYILLLKVSMEHRWKTKSSLKIYILAYAHRHTQTYRGKSKKIVFLTTGLIPSLQLILITWCVLNMQTYHKCSLSFQNTSFIDINRILQVGGKGSLYKNMKK